MKTVQVRQAVNIDCEFFGDEQAPLVVLISGAGAPAEFWPAFFCTGLADKGFRVLRYWHRDTGQSAHFDVPYDIWELHHDLISLIDSTEKPGVHLVGHSMGGFLCQLAVCYSSLSIQSVVTISAGSAVEKTLCTELGMSKPSETTWKVLMQNQPSGEFEKDLDGWLSTWMFLNGSVSFDKEQAVNYTKSLYIGDPRNAQVATNHVHAMSTIPAGLVKDLAKIHCPFLVLHGTEDLLVPYDNGKITARLVPDSKFVGLEGAGHMFFNKRIWLKILDYLVEHLTTH
jgi:pimeloyl-ACP methyl ester carboxylesterase